MYKKTENLMSDWVLIVKPVLIIDAEATEHSLHRHGIGKMKHIDVAHLWVQDEVKSNRLRVRRVKNEDNLADIGTKALSKRIIRSMRYSWRYVVVQENLKSGDVMGKDLRFNVFFVSSWCMRSLGLRIHQDLSISSLWCCGKVSGKFTCALEPPPCACAKSSTQTRSGLELCPPPFLQLLRATRHHHVS